MYYIKNIVNKIRYIILLSLVLSICACSANRIPEPTSGHIGLDDNSSGEVDKPINQIPAPVVQAPILPKPKVQPKLDTYTVVVNDVPVKELLFALARDAKLNLDVYDNIEGNITINAIDQTLPQILDRIGKQTNIRYQIEDGSLVISADTPHMKTYKVPYVNLSRGTTSQIDVSTQITSAGTVGVGGSESSGSSGSNNSQLRLTNSSVNNFWQSLFLSIATIIEDGSAKAAKGDKPLKSDNININREASLVSVRGTSKQHADIQKFLDAFINSVQKQVLIEATIVEVNLSNAYQAGVDWSRVTTGSNGLTYNQGLTPTGLLSNPVFSLDYNSTNPDNGDFQGTIRLLEEFGDTKVLSSPKIMALNNQTAILKVVDNRVYFTLEVDTVLNDNSSLTTFETTVNTVPIGLVMNLTPYISDSEQIILNVRPTITRILGFVEDPNPDLEAAGVTSEIPEVQVREMESVLRLNNGQVGVIGGLMQDSLQNETDAVPGLSRIPGVGRAFKSKNDSVTKTELVIFIKPIVINTPSLQADLNAYKAYLPSAPVVAPKKKP